MYTGEARAALTMPTVEGGICAAVLLVRLAHPNRGFTAVSGWAINNNTYNTKYSRIQPVLSNPVDK